MKTIIILLLLITSTTTYSQDSTLSFNFFNKNISKDSIAKLDFNSQSKGNIEVHQPKELKEITEFVSRNKDHMDQVKIEGYRIQIYFNENKSTALGQKANFLSSYGEHKAYLDYMAPNYRVRVGNFRTKLEAEKLKQELLSAYPTCIVLPDNIELPKIIEKE
ncbi:hypothetical protein DNU06_03535 [Putridiphycobacter roseus]|uniref:SPOR domain-containing protein n=1 Tax=Putridiphycobacter roseus TaxID=2219161 RepID=A0A2W1NTD1_9FLAO|nr:SPOR domain-containing protein [Putridiphycobacter roseus]PZE18912.1 hypothetical protein DNU06_03535 [Putridiphycobacter roseus]